MKILVASDHRGLALKEAAKRWLQQQKILFEDYGTDARTSVDYPDFAARVATEVARHPEEVLGVLFCGTGFGMAIAANKVPGVRAVACDQEGQAVLSRQHNNTNVIAMGELYVAPDKVAGILQAWLQASFQGGRHKKRVDKIAALEQQADTNQ